VFVREECISKLVFLQFDVQQGNIKANFEQVKKGLAILGPSAYSLIALPDMWATGFVYEDLATLSLEIPQLLQDLEHLAQAYNIVLAGSLPWQETGADGRERLTNRLFFSGSGQEKIPAIDKQHLFSFWKEDQWFQSGKYAEPVHIGAKSIVGGLVCYDLRFPDAARLRCRQGAEIILVSAQWPLARIAQWQILLQARAIENQCCYCCRKCLWGVGKFAIGWTFNGYFSRWYDFGRSG